MKHVMELYDQGGEDQDKTWLDRPVASEGQVEGFEVRDRARVTVKIEQDLAPIDQRNGEEHVGSRSMNQYGHAMI